MANNGTQHISPSQSTSIFTQLTEKSGEFYSVKLVAKLIGPVSELGFEYIEASCKKSLQLHGDIESIKRHEASKKSITKPEKRSYDIFSKLNSISKTQIKNHSIRFMIPESLEAAPRTSFLKFGIGGKDTESRDYEDVLSADILNAPISDICIVQSGEAVPDGFYRIYKTPGNRKASLNTNSGGNPIYLCIKKDLTGKAPVVTSIVTILPDHNENVPPGYSIVMRGKNACNINTGTSAERIYICYKKFASASPIVDIQPVFLSKAEEVPKDFNLIDKSPSGLSANLNFGTSGVEIFLTYKQNLLHLDYLRNDFRSASGMPNKARMTRQMSLEDVLSFQTSPSSQSSGLPFEGGASRSSSERATKTSSSNAGHQRQESSSLESLALRALPSRLGDDKPLHIDVDGSGNADNDDDRESVVDIGTVELTFGDEDERLGKDQSAVVTPLATGTSDVGAAIGTGTGSGSGPEEELMSGEDILLDVQAEDDSYESKRGIEVVDSNGNLSPEKSRFALLAILSAVYIRQGTVAQTAITGLTHLLKNTDFFENDLANIQQPNTITMMDLTIHTVCDRFDFALDAENDILLQFMAVLIKHSGARLSPISLQRMHRAISFVCNVHSTRRDWINAGLGMPCNDPLAELSPYKVLKQLIWDIVAHVETVEVAYFLPVPADYEDGYADLTSAESAAIYSETYIEIRFIVEDFIDDVIDSVETSRISEAALQFISKQSSIATSSYFWMTVDGFATRLFSSFQHRSAYVILCATCKTAWNSIRTTSSGEPVARDLGVKLIALEAITEFCLCAGEKMRQSKIMGYQIRRLVVPCLIYNMVYALVDHKVFAKLLKIISALWKKWRHCIRIEFAILCEQLVIKVLQASVVQIRPIFQMIVIQEVVNWFEPHLSLEMFVNYDMDRKFVSHWNVFSYLVRTICAIGRRLTVVTRAWEWKAAGVNSAPDESNKVAVTIRDVHLEALDQVVRIAKTLMDASGHAHLILRDEAHKRKSLMIGGGWTEDTVDEDEISTGSSATDLLSLPSSNSARTGGSANSVKLRVEAHKESEMIINKAIQIFQEKKSLSKAIKFLVKENFMNDTPQEIVNFLRVYKNNFDPVSIGDFLGEGGVTPAEVEYWSQIRFRYTRAVSFVEMELEPALRLYLTGCGFRLPGEAQKIDRFVEVFVKTFWQDNSGTSFCPFRQQLTVHLLSYAIIMLNTDLHRAHGNDSKGGKKRKKMTKDEFINNLRGIDQNNDIDREYLSRIYENIESNAIEMAVQTAAEAAAAQANISEKLAANDLAANRLGLSSTVFTALPQSTSKAITNEMRIAEEKAFVKDVCRSMRDSEDLLRSLAIFTYRFQLTGVDTKMSLDLVTYMYETVWFHFHAIAESLLTSEGADIDIRVQFSGLDILCYSLTSSIFLNMKPESMRFAHLLKSYSERCWHNKNSGSSSSNPNTSTNAGQVGVALDDSWFLDVEVADAGTASETIGKVHKLVVQLKDAIQETANRDITQNVAAKFEKKVRVLDTNTFFVKQGDLTKLNSYNRPVTYRFFLFSDELIYAHLSMKNEYKVNKQLSLSAMSVSDVDNDPTYCSFFLSHPVKSFVVFAESPASKQQWIRDIRQTIESCKKRELNKTSASALNRRMSMYGRIEGQVAIQTSETAITASPDSRSKQKALRRLQHTCHLDDLVNNPKSTSSSPPVAARGRKTESHDLEDFGNVDKISDHIFSTDEYLDNDSQTFHNNNSNSNHDSNGSSGDGNRNEAVSEGIACEISLPSVEERAQQQQDAILRFSELVKDLPEKSLGSLFQAGVEFWKGINSSRGSGGGLNEEVKQKLTLLHKKLKSESTNSSSSNSTSTGSYPPPFPLFDSDPNLHPSPDLIPDPPSSPTGPQTKAKEEEGKEPGKEGSSVTDSTGSSSGGDWLRAGVGLGQEGTAEDLRREFLCTLFTAFPYWKYDNFL